MTNSRINLKAEYTKFRAKREAVETFKQLVRQYGLQWTARVPREAWDQLRRCNQVLSEEDRRAAIAE